MIRTICFLISLLLFISLSFAQHRSTNLEMVDMLSEIADSTNYPENPAASNARLKHYKLSLTYAQQFDDSLNFQYLICQTLLELGREAEAIGLAEKMLTTVDDYSSENSYTIMRTLALAFLRRGERVNCVEGHTSASCIFPIKGEGLQKNTTASKKAISIYEKILFHDSTDMESRWLLNLASMAIGEYPNGVQSGFVIRGLDAPSSHTVSPFIDAAMHTGLDTENMAGGSIVEDFNNDGLLDIVTSGWGLEESMHYHQNNGDGTFTNVSKISQIDQITGGLNIIQTDYNNDGWKDIFVLRGAWLREFGQQPNSLLRNNGDGTFSDVTIESGLLSFHPTQTATWADFNNDGWLDVFIGNENRSLPDNHPCELYINNADGTFTEVAKTANCDLRLFAKGVTSGDFDNDGKVDLFISSMNGRKVLLKNTLTKNGKLKFKDVSNNSGINAQHTPTFSTWFWDYDNDGMLDLFCAGYDASNSLATYAAQDALNVLSKNNGSLFVFRNLGNGKFSDVSGTLGFGKGVFAMGANFGDINNDGFLDIYLGTGNPLFQSQIPNKMFLNISGNGFEDVTTSARVGSLQKGHGVSFGDLNNDGNLDIHIDMGGAYEGDAYQNSLYINSGGTENKSVSIMLEGMNANKAAIGAKLKLSFRDGDKQRIVYREVNSGGSFGANTLEQHIGIGSAKQIDHLEITWPGSNLRQEFTDIKAGESIRIVESEDVICNSNIKAFNFTADHNHH
jgi:hypothetical protein